jgi:LysM repeat protein
MNNQSPLIPQGSLLEQKNKGRLRVKIAVFLVLAVHGVGLMALLMAGCQKDKDSGASLMATNNPVPAFQPPTNLPPETNAAPPPATNVAPAPEPPTPQTNAVVTPITPVPATPAASEYKITKGDSFSSLAKKFHVSVKAIEEANPGVLPTKLKVGQTIHIPASMSGDTTPTSGISTAGSDTSGEQTYVVKSGDTLTKIAGGYGITVKALRNANPNLKTTKIKVGQKLKVPPKGAAPSVSTAASTEVPTTNPTPSTTGAPAPR